MDALFVMRPILLIAIAARLLAQAFGATVTVTAPGVRAGTITYYTLDGTDPRLPGGGVSPKAQVSVGATPLTVSTNVRVVARSPGMKTSTR